MMPILNYYIQTYGAVKILLVVTFCLLRHFCARSYCLSDSWVCFCEILMNLIHFEHNQCEVDHLILPLKGKYIFYYLSHNANF